MRFHRKAAWLVAAFALPVAAPAMAQVTHEARVSTSTSMHDGVATRTTKVVHVKKVKTHRVKRILGVKVGHKTRVTKVVREKSVSSNGDVTRSVHTSH
jgi:hypothetical protein